MIEINIVVDESHPTWAQHRVLNIAGPISGLLLEIRILSEKKRVQPTERSR
jgi:hypothetical protein